MQVKIYPKVHSLKIAKRFYKAVKDGSKTFEIRFDDRDYKIGDRIRFKTGQYSLDQLHILNWYEVPGEWEITYKLTATDFPEGIKDGFCILGLKEVNKNG